MSDSQKPLTKIRYFRLDEYWTQAQKYQFLEEKQHIYNVEWQEITPDAKNNWLTEGIHGEFDSFIPMGSKDAKAAKSIEVETIFKTYSRGVATSRDAWTYNFNCPILKENIKRSIDFYNEQVFKWINSDKQKVVDKFVTYDTSKIAWSETLKLNLKRGSIAQFNEENVRTSLYRPFTKEYLYFDRSMNERVYGLPSTFPTSKTETENQVICLPGIGGRTRFWSLASNCIPNLSLTSLDANQCFPFYIYNEDGTNRRENITDWSLTQFRKHFNNSQISKLDIFHYVYAILHHPTYREKYAANLKRELPRIPFAPEFSAFAAAGMRLAALHVGYEDQLEFPLESIENPEAEFTWRVEKMRLSKDKTALRYNEFLTLGNIPPETFDYRLGNRSALEWIVEQYRVTTDLRSGITNDPNRADDPQYIFRLVKKIVTVSVETVKIVNEIAELPIT